MKVSFSNIQKFLILLMFQLHADVDVVRLHEELAGQELNRRHLPGLLHLHLSRRAFENTSTVKG